MSNSWAQLVRLLPTVDSTVGKILSVDAVNGTAVLEGMSGGSCTVNMDKNAAYAVNDWVMVKDNVIISVIPVPKGENTAGVPKEIMIS